MKVLSSLALSGVVQALAPAFEAAQGVRLRCEFMPTAVLLPRLLGGEVADVVLLSADGASALVEAGVMFGDSRRALARSFVGVAVKAGAARPDISTREAFVAALLAAPSVAMSRHGISGLFLARLLPQLGIEDEVLAKATVIESGYTAELAARGEVALALQQVSELMVVPGVEIVGRVPAGLGGESVFAGGVLRSSGRPHLGAALLAAIADARDVLAAKGLEPV